MLSRKTLENKAKITYPSIGFLEGAVALNCRLDAFPRRRGNRARALLSGLRQHYSAGSRGDAEWRGDRRLPRDLQSHLFLGLLLEILDLSPTEAVGNCVRHVVWFHWQK